MMRNYFLFSFLASFLLLSGCKSGMVTGTVTFKGTPCQQGNAANVVPPCQGLYPNYKVEIKSQEDSKIVATTTTDANGAFNAKLKPGNYVIFTQGGVTKDFLHEYKFTIEKGKTATVSATVDTGIQ